MIAIVNALNRFLGSIFEELLSLSWQGTLLILLVLGVTLCWRSGPACFKYGLWFMVLVRLILPIHIASPTGAINLLPEPTVPTLFVEADPSPVTFSEIVPAVEPVQTPQGPRPWDWRSCTGFLWAMGAAFYLLLSMARYSRMRRLLHRSALAPSSALMTEVNALREALRLKREVPVFESDSVDSPLLMGLIRPTVVLPRDFIKSLNLGERRAILAHELMHVKRLDHLAIGVELFVRAIHFFNPLVWLAIARLRSERERSCDDRVVAFLGGEPGDYSSSLLKVVRFKNDSAIRVHGALTLSDKKSETGNRVRRILTPSRRVVPRLSVLALLVLGVVASVVLPGRTMSVRVDEKRKINEEETAQMAKSGQWEATSSAGVRVELVGVSTHPSSTSSWWRPDGSSLAEAPYDHDGGQLYPPKSEKVFEFAVRLHNTPEIAVSTRMKITPVGSVTSIGT